MPLPISEMEDKKTIGVIIIPFDREQEFYVSKYIIEHYFPYGAFRIYLIENFSEEPILHVRWCSNSFRQLENWIEFGTIKDPEFRRENRFCYDGEPVEWKYFFEWVGLSHEEIKNDVKIEPFEKD